MMKAKDGFVLRKTVGEYMLMPTGENTGGCMLLNRVSAFIWERLRQAPASRGELLAAVLDKYAVDEATAAADLDALLARFDQLGMLENE